MVLFFVYLIVVIALLFVMKPKNPQISETNIDDIGVPTASAGRPIPIVFGTVLIKSPNVVWYGDLKKEKVYA